MTATIMHYATALYLIVTGSFITFALLTLIWAALIAIVVRAHHVIMTAPKDKP